MKVVKDRLQEIHNFILKVKKRNKKIGRAYLRREESVLISPVISWEYCCAKLPNHSLSFIVSGDQRGTPLYHKN